MIIIRMSGGLGNQMFQYALYLKLKALGRDVCFDDASQYDKEAFKNSDQKRRPKHLRIFGIHYPKVSQEDLTCMTDSSMNVSSRIRRKLTGRKSLEKRDEDFVYDPGFLEETEGYYCGCFQSPRYFAGEEAAVRKAFTFPPDLLEIPGDANKKERRILEQAAHYAERIRKANENGGSAAIHLRFGDYVDKGDIYGGICTDAYYNTAIQKLKDKSSEMTFFVFSNDEEKAGEWIRFQAERQENLGRGHFVLVKGSDEDHGYLDLYLMTLCGNHIIANSSFSWWGAWLCREPGKTVFAPSVWNNQKDGSELRRVDIYADFMRRINPAGQELSEEPLLSVIITAYNVKEYIGRALDSVRNQTWKNLEIIVVDDGSTDGTAALLDEYVAADARIQVIHTGNRGVSAARNEGIEHAKGEYIGFVDGDDVAHPEMYETMLRGMLASGARMAAVNYREVTTTAIHGVGNKAPAADSKALQAATAEIRTPHAAMKTTDPAENITKTDQNEIKSVNIDPSLTASVLLTQREAVACFIRAGIEGTDGKVVLHSAVWSKLFHKSLLKGNRFPEGTSAEDIPFTTCALCHTRKVLYIPTPLYDYVHNREESIMNSGRAVRTLTQEIPAWRVHMEMLKDAGLYDLAEESEYWFYRRMLFYEEDYRSCSETQKEAQELEERILSHKERILELCSEHSYGRRGDRERLKLYAESPKRYYMLARLYEKTVVAWKNRRS